MKNPGDRSGHPLPSFDQLGLKHLHEGELLENLFLLGEEWSDDEHELVRLAYDFAAELHKEDRHKDNPYTYHLLRNANRAMGYLDVRDPELVAGILLHDGVEDHAREIVEWHAYVTAMTDEIVLDVPEDPHELQQAALEVIAGLFSPRVSEIVASVTNAPTDNTEDLSREEWLDRYGKKVAQAVETYEGWVTKVVDWIDNGLGIVHSELPKGAPQLAHFAQKYGFVTPLFMYRYRQADIQKRLSDEAKAYLEQQFMLASQRLIVAPEI